jgi:SAM-dependent methyltransferase
MPALAASLWVQRFAPLIRPGGSVLDVACGSGRHVRWLAAQGWQLTGIDKNAAAVETLHGLADIVVADIEGNAWPLPGRRFDAVVVTHYLWRSLWPDLLASLAEGGVLIYETFANGQQSLGQPSRPEFLLRTGELLQAFSALRVVAFEDGFEPTPPHYVQRIAAVRPGPPGDGPPARYGLHSPSS